MPEYLLKNVFTATVQVLTDGVSLSPNVQVSVMCDMEKSVELVNTLSLFVQTPTSSFTINAYIDAWSGEQLPFYSHATVVFSACPAGGITVEVSLERGKEHRQTCFRAVSPGFVELFTPCENQLHMTTSETSNPCVIN